AGTPVGSCGGVMAATIRAAGGRYHIPDRPPRQDPPMTTPAPLNPPQRLLLGPGPSDVHPRVLSAMATPLLGHLDPAFLAIMQETQELLRAAYLTKNPLTFPVSATGMAGMEACIVNLGAPGGKIVICAGGLFRSPMV